MLKYGVILTNAILTNQSILRPKRGFGINPTGSSDNESETKSNRNSDFELF